MKKLLALTTIMVITSARADVSGIYLGGGVGYGNQELSQNGQKSTFGTPAIRLFTGYQFAQWVGAEFGYTYISQGDNTNGVGNPSTTVYDLSFTPGFTLPNTPVTIFTRLGIDGVSANLNSSWYNQVVSNLQANFVWGLGAKLDIPNSRTFVRAEYMNFGGVTNNNNSSVSVIPSAVMITGGYVF